jgi:hypothetical protein
VVTKAKSHHRWNRVCGSAPEQVRREAQHEAEFEATMEADRQLLEERHLAKDAVKKAALIGELGGSLPRRAWMGFFVRQSQGFFARQRQGLFVRQRQGCPACQRRYHRGAVD